MWLVIALIATLCWSGSDLFSKIGSKPSDKYSHWKMVMAVGFVMGLHAIYEIATGTPITLRDIIYYLPASSMYILSCDCTASQSSPQEFTVIESSNAAIVYNIFFIVFSFR